MGAARHVLGTKPPAYWVGGVVAAAAVLAALFYLVGLIAALLAPVVG